MNAPPALSIGGLRFRYPAAKAIALDDLSLDVAAGERVAVLGANGSGKTTLALHVNGLLEAEAGSIEVGGTPLDRSTRGEIRRRVGLVFQDADDQLFMPTVLDDVAFGPANLGQRDGDLERDVADALAAVGAQHLRDRTSHQLSGGEKRRVALATVLAMRPELLVLDEPTSGLDPRGRREFADVLASLSAAQLVITHDLPFALATCPRSVIVSSGRIAADGATRDLLADGDLLARHDLELPFGYPPPQ